MDRVGMNLEVSTAELEGVGADESGEHFFDAREAHSDENPSESELMERKDEEDVQIRISGELISFLLGLAPSPSSILETWAQF